MRRLIDGIWKQLRKQSSSSRRTPPLRARLSLESLETRLTPASASGVITGQVVFGAGDSGFGGVPVSLVGTTTTNRTVNLTTQSNSQGQYTFTGLLPGQYNLVSAIPKGYIGSGNSNIANFTLGDGQTSVGPTLVTGLQLSNISLAYFFSVNPLGAGLPASGTGSSTTGFTLSTATLANQALTASGHKVVDLSGFFLDPDTTNTTITFNTTLNSMANNFSFNLSDKATPQSVTDFLNYIQSGAYTSSMFHRLDNLSFQQPQSPASPFIPTGPYNIIQGGLDKVADSSGAAFTPISLYQPVQNESNNTLRPNAAGTIALARTTDVNSATSQFYFNLTDNSTSLGGQAAGQGYTVFGTVADATSMTNLTNFAAAYNPQAFNLGTSLTGTTTVPYLKTAGTPTGTPGSGNTVTPLSGTGQPVADFAVINNVTVTTASAGHMTYSVTSSNPLVTATLGSLNFGTAAAGGGFLAPNQLQLSAGALAVGQTATSVITVVATDARGESTTTQFTTTVTGAT